MPFLHVARDIDRDHRAEPDLDRLDTPVRVCAVCGATIKPAPQRTDITGGILRFIPQAVVESRTFEGGTHYTVKAPGHRVVRYAVEHGDDEAQALQVILRALNDARYESQ